MSPLLVCAQPSQLVSLLGGRGQPQGHSRSKLGSCGTATPETTRGSPSATCMVGIGIGEKKNGVGEEGIKPPSERELSILVETGDLVNIGVKVTSSPESGILRFMHGTFSICKLQTSQ